MIANETSRRAKYPNIWLYKTTEKMAKFFAGLKSRSDEVRVREARNLQKFVSTELRELPAETYSKELNEINQSIFALMSSSELHEKKGGILAIGK